MPPHRHVAVPTCSVVLYSQCKIPTWAPVCKTPKRVLPAALNGHATPTPVHQTRRSSCRFHCVQLCGLRKRQIRVSIIVRHMVFSLFSGLHLALEQFSDCEQGSVPMNMSHILHLVYIGVGWPNNSEFNYFVKQTRHDPPAWSGIELEVLSLFSGQKGRAYQETKPRERTSCFRAARPESESEDEPGQEPRGVGRRELDGLQLLEEEGEEPRKQARDKFSPVEYRLPGGLHASTRPRAFPAS